MIIDTKLNKKVNELLNSSRIVPKMELDKV